MSAWSPQERAMAALGPAGLAYTYTGGFRPAASRTGPLWFPAEHLLLIDEAVVRMTARIRDTQRRIASGEALSTEQGPRLMVFMPPRHGKSELISKYTPAWFLGRNPDLRCIVASYGAALANQWGRKTRDLLREVGESLYGNVKISDASGRADQWDIADRTGGLVSAGIGGALTGKGGHLIIVDDPVKDQEEAQSEVIRQRNKDWWAATLRTRLMPGGGIIVLQTRWHEDDLSGWLLQQEKDGLGETWEVLNLPAIAVEEGDALGRQVGDPLWPQMYPLPALQSTALALGKYWWAALYQQDPMPAGGGIFHRDDFRYWRPDPDDPDLFRVFTDGAPEGRLVSVHDCYEFATIDTALSEKQTADYTVVQRWRVTSQRELVLVDMERQHFEHPKVKDFVTRTVYGAWGMIDVRVEDKAAGTALIQQLRNEGYAVRPLVADLDKVTRALGAVPRWEAHQVFHPEGAPWLEVFERELLGFPNGANDDMVDAAVYAALALPSIPVGVRRQRGDEDRAKTTMGGIRTKQL